MKQALKIKLSTFMQDPAIENIFTIMGDRGGDIKFVGGCVRDAILERKTQDIDLATDLRPEDVVAILEENNVPYIKDKGIEYGTVTALISNIYFPDIKKVEISSLRKDVETYGRQAKVEYSRHFQEDAMRRDFTINSLYADFDGTLYDYFNGYEDLLEHKLIFIGDPDERIKEDYLRILRYFRFYATIDNMMLDQYALAACVNNADNLYQLSPERIAKEFFMILDSKNPSKVLSLMKKGSILKEIITGVTNFDTLDYLVDLENKSKTILPNVTSGLVRRLASITKPSKEIAGKNAEKLRLSKAQTKRLIDLSDPPFEVFNEIEKAQARRILHNYGSELFQDVVLLRWSQEISKSGSMDTSTTEKWYDLLDMASEWRPLEFGVKGSDVINRGIPKGKYVGEILFELENWWQDRDFRPEKEEILQELDNLVLKYQKNL
ncbi:MAG: CCA tRNA nucleotidyltransferase [Alphaproteobacteria bacterium]